MKRLFFPLFSGVLILSSCSQKQNRAAAEAVALATALDGHHLEYSVFPPEDNRAVSSAIRGGNARRIVFMEVPPAMLNAGGELVDPWGTAYRFTFLPENTIAVLSAGSDRKFGTGDDILRKKKARSL